MNPRGVEPRSTGPKPGILSIELRVHTELQRKRYLNLCWFVFLRKKMVKKYYTKKFWATAFTLTGGIIGAGILGLPYVFSRSGFLIGFVWLVILGLIMMYINLCIGEISLRTKHNHQLVGYAEKYLGRKAKGIMVFAVAFGIYSALLAYLIGEGQSLSQLFTGGIDKAIYFAVGFWLIMNLALRKGLKELKRIELWGVGAIIFIILLIATWYSPQINIENVQFIDYSNIFLPLGVTLFALLGFTAIPELRMEIRGKEKKLKKAIIIGSLIPIVLYAIFAFVFIGVWGKGISEVATVGLGNLVVFLGIFTMLTSYLILNFSLRDIYYYDLKYSGNRTYLLTTTLPLVLYLIVSYFDLINFVQILGIGGVISGSITGILILLINKKAKKSRGRKPEFEVPINWIWIGLLSLIFILGVVVELYF